MFRSTSTTDIVDLMDRGASLFKDPEKPTGELRIPASEDQQASVGIVPASMISTLLDQGKIESAGGGFYRTTAQNRPG